MQESRLYTGIPKWRERLGIEPSSRFSTGTTVLKTAAGTSLAIIPKIVFYYPLLNSNFLAFSAP